MPAQITEFCFNHSPWRIDYLGGLIYPSDPRTEPRIVVYLSELSIESLDPMSNGSLAKGQRHEVATINVGQICLLRIGSVWIDGVCVAPFKPLSRRSFSLTPHQLTLMRFDGKVNIEGAPETLFTQMRYRIGEQAVKELAGSWLAIVNEPVEGTAFLVIPSPTIFQKCFATSPKAVQRLVFGELDKIADPCSHFLPDEPGTYYLELFKDFADREAKAIANLRADLIGQMEYMRLRDAIVVASANQDRSQPTRAVAPHMKLSLPFSKTVHLTVLGKSLPFNVTDNGRTRTVYGFLATEILGLRTQLPFDRLVVGRKNDNQQGTNADDPALAEGWSPKTKPRPSNSDHFQPLVSGPVPDKSLEQLSLEAAGDFDVEVLEIIDKPKEVQKYKNRIRISSDDAQQQGSATTGDPGPGHSGNPVTDIVPQQAPSVPVTLDEFFEVIEALRTNGLQCQTLATSSTYRVRDFDDEVINFLPRRIKHVRSWHLIQHTRDAVPRAYVVAELQRGGVWHYLIELERKGSEAFALQHIRSHNGARIDRIAIGQFMVNVAVENGWGARNRYKTWVFKSINHPSRGSAKRFARLIADAL